MRSSWPQRLAARVPDRVQPLLSLARDLAPYGIRETVQRDDLHDGQVFVRDGRHWVMDWSDARVSHPFFTLSVTLEGVNGAIVGNNAHTAARLTMFLDGRVGD